MKIAFVVNDVTTEKPAYTTTRLAQAASLMGHDVFYIGTDDFAFDADDTVAARTRKAPRRKGTLEEYMAAVQSDSSIERRDLGGMDVVCYATIPPTTCRTPLRQYRRHRIRPAGGVEGTLVVNDPLGLARGQQDLLPVLSPTASGPHAGLPGRRGNPGLRGSSRAAGGAQAAAGFGRAGVFFVNARTTSPNLNQMIEAVAATATSSRRSTCPTRPRATSGCS